MMNNSEVGMVNSETKNPAECWSAGVMGRWSNLATPLSAISYVGFLNRRERRGNPDSKSALRYLRLLLFRIQANPFMNRIAFPLYNPTEHWSVAAFVRKPQMNVFPTLHHFITPGQSSLIKPNQAIFPCFDMTADPQTAKFRNCQLPRSVRSDRSVVIAPPLPACDCRPNSCFRFDPERLI